jgi:hypothetical protein
MEYNSSIYKVGIIVEYPDKPKCGIGGIDVSELDIDIGEKNVSMLS